MSPHSCGMAAIPVRPENHGTRAAGAYGDGPCLLPPCLLPPYLLPPYLLPLCQLHPSAAVSRPLSPGCYLPAAISPRLLSSGCCLPAAVFRPPCCRANAACPPCQWVALYQPVFWMLFTTIPLVLGALVEMPE